jgi:hypothetical protein
MFLLLADRDSHKVQEDILKNLDMVDATTLRHHLIDQIYITKYEQKTANRILFVLLNIRKIRDYTVLVGKKKWKLDRRFCRSTG